MQKQTRAFKDREYHCRECGKGYLKFSDEILKMVPVLAESQLVWAHDMGFCSYYCLRAWNNYYKYLTEEDVDGDTE